jgi:hypothetical protein
MKNFILILFLSLGFALHGTAQDGGGKEGKGTKLEALKIAYLTQKLNLSTEEAQRFWPIYNSYTNEIRKIRQEQKEKNLPEIDAEDKILNVRKRYNGEFSKALSADKANTFFRSEKEFGGYIQRELQERRMNRQLNKQRPFRQ